MDIENLTTFLGCCTVINSIILLVSTVGLTVGRQRVERIHARMFQMDTQQLSVVYFQYLSHYKFAILILNLVPYLALKWMQWVA